MGHRASLLRLLALASLLASASGCGASYQLLRESSTDVRLLATAGVVSVAPLTFQVAPETNPEDWPGYLALWDAAYTEALIQGVRDLGVPTVQRLGPGESALEGTMITAVVREIRRGSYMGDDRLVALVQFVDAATGQSRLAAELEVSSTTANSQRYLFPGRIRIASIKLAWAVTEGLQRGTFVR